MENKKLEIKPLKTIYGIGDKFFDTLDELRAFCGSNNRSMTGWFQLNYVGDFSGKTDVISIWNSVSTKTSILVAGNITEEQNKDWESLCHERYDEKTNSWKLCQDNLITYYRALRDRGVEFSNDVYAPVEQYLDEVHNRQPETGGRQFVLTNPNQQ